MTKPDLISVVPLLPPHMERLAERFTVRPLPASGQEAFLAGFADRARFVQTFGANGFPTAWIDALPKLEIVAVMGVGVDAVDVKTCAARGIRVTNTPDVLNDDVADLALALMLMACRQLALSDRFVRAGRWLKGSQPLATKLSGKRLGILGLGRIGKAIARRALSFDMTIAYHGRTAQADQPFAFYPDLVAMARDVDILVAICPGGPATRHLVNAAVLDALGPQGVFVNVSRGSVADEAALVAALRDRRIGHAALDVFANEPNVPPELFAMDHVTLAPHVGSATVETRTAMCDLVVDNLFAHLDGRPLPTPVV